MPREESKTRRLMRRVKQLTARLAPFAAAGSAGLLLWHAASDMPAPIQALPAPLIYVNAPPPPNTAPPANRPPAGLVAAAATAPRAMASVPDAAAEVQQAGIASTIDVVVGRNDTLDRIFRRMALDTGDLAAIRDLPGIRQSLDFLKPGDAIRVIHSGGAVKELTRQVSETETLKVVRRPAGFSAQMINDPVDIRVRAATATIGSSLFQAASAAQISDAVALQIADIFAWDIDFVLDIREGDRFSAVYQQIFQNGKYLRDGAVLAAEFVNDGQQYIAVRYAAADGRVGYYTPQGVPMRKAFLRAPLRFTRVSSGFNPHRMHPILHRIRGHMGTDYAAPIGTPVQASGDGRVSFVGRRGGYGNAIVLAHGRRISTLYGHLSRFAKHLHVGTVVQQGEVIGYVGMTGLATGPHLHYEFLVNGVHENPQTVRLPGAEPLSAAALREFASEAAPLLADLRAPEASGAQSSSATSPIAANPLAAAIAPHRGAVALRRSAD